VLLSGIGWRGKPHECLELARSGTIVGVTCREILDELAEKLTAKLKMSDEVTSDAIADVLSFLAVIPIDGQLHVVTADPDDDKIIECAVAANASMIVSGDRKHLLSLGRYGDIDIVSPAELLERLADDDTKE